jgi:hypothetical protein
MGYAFVTPEGYIRKTMVKISPFDVLIDGDIIVDYSPPNIDYEVENLTTIEPVVGSVVQFSITPKDTTTVNAVWKARKTAVIQLHLDTKAREFGYDSIFSATTYATSLNPRFGPEGIAFRDWRDSTWAAGYTILYDVEASTRTMPSDEELLLELPAFPGVIY